MMMPLRILMISDVYFPRVNGVSTSIQSFAHELQAQGHTVTLIAPDYGTTEESTFKIIRVPSRKVIVDPEDRMLSMHWVLERTRMLSDRDFDLIHVHTPFVAHYLGVKLARRLGLPLVETYHTYFEEYLYNYIPLVPKPLLKRVARVFSRSQCNQVDRVVVPSAPIEQALEGYGVTTPITILPTGLNLSRFGEGDGRRFRKQHGIEPERPMALYVGRMAHEKNVRFLFKAMQEAIRRLPNMLFVMAGEGPAQAWLHRQIKKFGLQQNILSIGYMDRNHELLDCYRAADVFVFASRTETQGLVLLEALALGTPVVSTAILGTKTVLEEGAGAWIAEEQLDDFTGKVVTLLENREQRRILAVAAREYIERWSIQVMTGRLLKLYETLDLIRPEDILTLEVDSESG